MLLPGHDAVPPVMFCTYNYNSVLHFELISVKAILLLVPPHQPGGQDTSHYLVLSPLRASDYLEVVESRTSRLHGGPQMMGRIHRDGSKQRNGHTIEFASRTG